MNNCYICNTLLKPSEQEVISIHEAPEDDQDRRNFLVESYVAASFCASCFWDNCDSKIVRFKDRAHANCLYCQNKVDTTTKYFYLSWLRSFDVVSSEMIHGKCYDENIGIHKKTEMRWANNTKFNFNWSAPAWHHSIVNNSLDKDKK